MNLYKLVLPLSALGLVMARINQAQGGDLEYVQTLMINSVTPLVDGSEHYCNLEIMAKYECDINSIIETLDSFYIDYEVR